MSLGKVWIGSVGPFMFDVDAGHYALKVEDAPVSIKSEGVEIEIHPITGIIKVTGGGGVFPSLFFLREGEDGSGSVMKLSNGPLQLSNVVGPAFLMRGVEIGPFAELPVTTNLISEPPSRHQVTVGAEIVGGDIEDPETLEIDVVVRFHTGQRVVIAKNY